MSFPFTCRESFRVARNISEISQRSSPKEDIDLTVLTSNAITGRGWVDPFFGQYSSVKEETIDGVRVRRLKTRWQMTSTMYLLRQVANGFLPSSIENIVSLLSAGPYLPKLKAGISKGKIRSDPRHCLSIRPRLAGTKGLSISGKTFCLHPVDSFRRSKSQQSASLENPSRCRSVIACSNYEREGMIRKGIDPSGIHLIPMGIDLEEWANPDGERFREKYRLEGKKIILFAGTKGYNKGALHFLQAMKKTGQAAKEVVWVAIGLKTEEWEREKRRAGATNLLDLGYVSEEEKRDAFAACDLFVMPSRYDSFGIVYLEAWRCGKPVIGARVGAIPEVIDDGKDGLLVDFGNVDQLVSAIVPSSLCWFM